MTSLLSRVLCLRNSITVLPRFSALILLIVYAASFSGCAQLGLPPLFITQHPQSFVFTNNDKWAACDSGRNGVPDPESEFRIDEPIIMFVSGWSGNMWIRISTLKSHDANPKEISVYPLPHVPPDRWLCSKLHPHFGVQNMLGEPWSGLFLAELLSESKTVLERRYVLILDR